MYVTRCSGNISEGVQEELPKYERGSISALTACNILRDLDDARALDDATARYLTTLFVPEARRGAHGALKFQLPKAAAILDEMVRACVPCAALR